jgi:hypothetical protein
MVRGDADLSNETFSSPERSTPVSGTGPTNCNAVVSGRFSSYLPPIVIIVKYSLLLEICPFLIRLS